MKIEKMPLITIEDCYSFSDVAEKLGLPKNGKSLKKAKEYIGHYQINVDHFNSTIKRMKYQKAIINCPVCNTEFETQIGHPKAKQTCSYACSNTHFRSGINNPNFKNDGVKSYRTICFHYHQKECIICGESNIIDVHHYDENHNNNEPENLVPLCPTHHMYMHSQYKHLIEDKVHAYVDVSIKTKSASQSQIKL